jgi:Ca-activated chloride channel family protein
VKNPLLRRISLFKRNEKPRMSSERIASARLILLLIISLNSVFLPLTSTAQTDRQLVRQGNKQFRAGKFAEAEVDYRKAIEKNAKNP